MATKKTNRIISFVMPVLNEEKSLEEAVASVFSQELPRDSRCELILALGPSKDATNAIAEKLSKEYSNLVLCDNPKGLTSAGLNTAIGKANGDVIIRVDAHARLTQGYAKTAIETLDSNPKIGNVGGVMRAQGDDDFTNAVAWAYTSRYGLGGGKFHVGGDAGAVDTVYLGVFRKSVLVEAGFFDECVVRGQDWELNQRIRNLGHLVWFDPRLEVFYRPRSSWKALASQFYKTGLWRGKLSRTDFPNISAKYLAPPLLIILTLFWVPVWVYLFAIGLIAYTAKLPYSSRIYLLLVLPTMHYTWGAGFILGILFPALAKAEGE